VESFLSSLLSSLLLSLLSEEEDDDDGDDDDVEEKYRARVRSDVVSLAIVPYWKRGWVAHRWWWWWWWWPASNDEILHCAPINRHFGGSFERRLVDAAATTPRELLLSGVPKRKRSFALIVAVLLSRFVVCCYSRSLTLSFVGSTLTIYLWNDSYRSSSAAGLRKKTVEIHHST